MLPKRTEDFAMSEPFYRKPLAGLMLLAGAAGGPYMMFETDLGKNASQGAAQIFGNTTTTGDAKVGQAEPGRLVAFEPGSATTANPLNPMLAEHNLQQPAVHSLQEVLRFDITPGWVMQRFPRVTTVLADTQLDGLRVPLITGTSPSDIAGTLTYSFDRYQRLQRLTVHGATGDATRFIAELQQQYQMQQVPSLGGVLYMLSWNGRPTSIVHVEPAAVIYGDSPYSRFNILIELNQAGLEYGLSPEAKRLLDAGKSTRRW